MGFSSYLPFGQGALDGGELCMTPLSYSTPLFIIVLATAALYLIDIFLFRNFKAQKLVLGLGMWCNIASMGFVAYYNLAADSVGYNVFWSLGCYLMVAAFILAYLAQRYIHRDENLLRSYDRLR